GRHGSSAFGRPTGTVFNGGTSFAVTGEGGTGPSLFLFATQDGTIAGWNPGVDLFHAVVAVDNSAMANYTGLAIASTRRGDFLYAANFRTGTIDVFDADFHAVHRPGAFRDPNRPAGYVPFNVQAIGN